MFSEIQGYPNVRYFLIPFPQEMLDSHSSQINLAEKESRKKLRGHVCCEEKTHIESAWGKTRRIKQGLNARVNMSDPCQHCPLVAN